MIKRILFDLGEVVFTNDWHYECPEKFAEYTEYFGITYDQMEAGWVTCWPQYEIGKITEDEFWTLFLTNAGSKKIDIGHAKDLWKKYFGEKPGMLDLLEKLKDKHKLVVFSSTGKEWMEYKKQKYHLDRYFVDYITSCGAGLSKKDPALYQYVINHLGLKPEEILIIDDNQNVVEQAQKAGMNTILFMDAEQLETELGKMQLL